MGILGRYEEALVSYDRVVELDPRYALAWLVRGNALGILGRYEEALPCFEEAQRLGSIQAAKFIARCRKQLGQA